MRWDQDRETWITATTALAELRSGTPGHGHVVVVHGDYCLPNVVVEDGTVSGFLDVGALGRGDPWIDLVACDRSGRRNLGAQWDRERFFARYGESPDRSRMRWFWLLSELSLPEGPEGST